jgi:hypothetical protein
VWSIVRFQLDESGGTTKLTFDHEAFPEAETEHLAGGWHRMYWEPLRKRVG